MSDTQMIKSGTRVTKDGNKQFKEWQRVAASCTMNDNEGTTSDNKWQRMTASSHFGENSFC